MHIHPLQLMGNREIKTKRKEKIVGSRYNITWKRFCAAFEFYVETVAPFPLLWSLIYILNLIRKEKKNKTRKIGKNRYRRLLLYDRTNLRVFSFFLNVLLPPSEGLARESNTF